MIQRKQTIYLLLSALILASIFLHTFDFAQISTDGAESLSNTQYLQDKVLDVYDHILFMILTGLISGLSLLAIFLYKNRNLQLSVSKTNIVLCIILMVDIAYCLIQDINKIDGIYSIVPYFGLWAILLAIVAILLAIRGINHDNKLVKSMDRLR
ncbi:DUF4293 domain-containing protein [Membranihabitans marinus]|uniref:DUF4293 domain-containing protein n=1 Tax=Membranihabitans marinus TaxID=1227546 RepID=UPI001F195EA8|nr:DUF4293 domain-containing protein [Membranihabitans marinus]